MKQMVKQLKKDPKRIPRPDRYEMMCMFTKAMASVTMDVNTRMKKLWLTNALDGSEDYPVSRLSALVGDSLVKKRELLMKESPKTLQALIRSMTPPKGVQKKGHRTGEAPDDESFKLLNFERDLEPHEAVESDYVNEEEENSNISATTCRWSHSMYWWRSACNCAVTRPFWKRGPRRINTRRRWSFMEGSYDCPWFAEVAKFLTKFYQCMNE